MPKGLISKRCLEEGSPNIRWHIDLRSATFNQGGSRFVTGGFPYAAEHAGWMRTSTGTALCEEFSALPPSEVSKSLVW